jgi:2,5-diamino-6-(ribosylamino)-4(3H)-pyrimidinone 5'-phosphate reductase
MEQAMLPYVMLQNVVSVDGRIDGFNADIGLFYQLVGRLGADAHLAGSDTLLASEEAIVPETEEDLKPPIHNPNDTRPLLVVPDSRGRLRNWHVLRKSGYWREALALCSSTTPHEYLEYLKARHIETIIGGTDHVDLRSALEMLYASYGVKRVYVDSGGTLNGVLLREGLVGEVALLIHPALVGGTSPRSMYRAPDLTTSEPAIGLQLMHWERLEGDILWLRYKLNKTGGK